MSAELVRLSAPPSGATTPRSKLDSLSREDLIRFVKKQVENLKLLKAENAKLKEQNEHTTKAFQDAEEEWSKKLSEANEQLSENVSELAQLKEDRDSLRSINADLSLQIAQFSDQLTQLKKLPVESNQSSEKLGDEEHQSHETKNDTSRSTKEEERLHDELDELNTTIEAQRNEMKTLIESFGEQTEKLAKTEKRNEELQCMVDELRSSLDDTNEQLNAIKEKRNAENVFSLELADYEKSLEKVQKELKITKEECGSLNEELERARLEINASRDEKQQLSNRINKMKSAIVKLKVELDEKKAIINGLEAMKQTLEGNLAKVNEERNDEKIEFGAAIGSAEEKIRQLEATCTSLNRQLVSLRSQRESLQRQYDDLCEEHNTFKTRALYVLEQKKSDVTEDAKNDYVEQLEQTIEQQKKTIETLTQTQRATHEELCSIREHSLALTAQLRNVERQLNSANDEHKKSLIEQRNQYESRLTAESKLNAELLSQIDANFMAHTQEKQRLLSESAKERDALNAQMEVIKRSLDDETKRRKEAERNRSPANIILPSKQQRRQSGLVEVNSSFLQRPQRNEEIRNSVGEQQQPEMERTLEDVLYGDDADTAISATIYDGWQTVDDVKNWEEIAINTHRQLEHTRELLNESEASNVRLSEQTKLLKEEIRRLERNQARKDHLENSEYLKNVILKFIAPEKVSAERGQLIPVLATMLKLSNDEIEMLNRIAQTDLTLVNTQTTSPSSWGSYLHRWSGIS